MHLSNLNWKDSQELILWLTPKMTMEQIAALKAEKPELYYKLLQGVKTKTVSIQEKPVSKNV